MFTPCRCFYILVPRDQVFSLVHVMYQILAAAMRHEAANSKFFVSEVSDLDNVSNISKGVKSSHFQLISSFSKHYLESKFKLFSVIFRPYLVFLPRFNAVFPWVLSMKSRTPVFCSSLEHFPTGIMKAGFEISKVVGRQTE